MMYLFIRRNALALMQSRVLEFWTLGDAVYYFLLHVLSLLATGALLCLLKLFFFCFFMKDFNVNLAPEQFTIPNTQTCSSEHIPIMFMGQQRTQVGKIVPNRIPIMPASSVCPRPEKICSTILLLFSVSGRRSCHAGQSPFCWLFMPSIYSWIYHLSGKEAAVGWWDLSYTTFNHCNCGASVDLYFVGLQTCGFLYDYRLEFAVHKYCNCCNLGITRCKKLPVLMCAEKEKCAPSSGLVSCAVCLQRTDKPLCADSSGAH